MVDGRKLAFGLSVLFATACALLIAYPWIDKHYFSPNKPETSVTTPIAPTEPKIDNLAETPERPADVPIEFVETRTIPEVKADVAVAPVEVKEDVSTTAPPLSEPQAPSVTDIEQDNREHAILLSNALEQLNSAAEAADEFEATLLQIESMNLSDAEHLSSQLVGLTNAERTSKAKLTSMKERVGLLQVELQRSSDNDPPRTVTSEGSDVEGLIANAKRANAEWKAAADRIASLLKKYEMLEQARSPEVQAALAVVLMPRDVQPRKSGGSLQLRRTFETTPMSLSAIRNTGALAPSMDGLRWLSKVVGDRKLKGRWAINVQPNSWSEDDKKRLKETQGYLIKFGTTLVEDGQLIP